MPSLIFKIEKKIEAKNLGKTEFAKLIGVSRDTVYKWSDETIKVSTLLKVCAVLEIDIVDFFIQDDQKKINEAAEMNSNYKAELDFYRDLYEKIQKQVEVLQEAIMLMSEKKKNKV